MYRVTKLASAALIALTLAGGSYAPVQQLAGDPSQWGVGDVYTKGSFDITETEQPIAGSKGDKAEAGRDPAIIAGSAGASSKVVRESS